VPVSCPRRAGHAQRDRYGLLRAWHPRRCLGVPFRLTGRGGEFGQALGIVDDGVRDVAEARVSVSAVLPRQVESLVGGDAVDLGEYAFGLFDDNAGVEGVLELLGEQFAVPQGAACSSPMVATSASAWMTRTSSGAISPTWLPKRLRAPMT
jgi:hypothetical protein